LHNVDVAHVNDRASEDAAWAVIVAATCAQVPALV
jgi:hypothetical protein